MCDFRYCIHRILIITFSFRNLYNIQGNSVQNDLKVIVIDVQIVYVFCNQIDYSIVIKHATLHCNRKCNDIEENIIFSITFIVWMTFWDTLFRVVFFFFTNVRVGVNPNPDFHTVYFVYLIKIEDTRWVLPYRSIGNA